MANTDDTPDSAVPATATDLSTATPCNTGARAVLTEEGEPSAYYALTLAEAQTKAEAEAKEAKAQAKEAKAAAAKAAKAIKRKIAVQHAIYIKPKPSKPKQYKMKRERFLTVADTRTTRTPTPWIRLSGKWLEQAGFPVSARVKIEVSEGKLIITPEADAA